MPQFTAQPLLRTLKYTLADEEGTLHSWRKAFIEMNLHFGRNSLIIAMLIGLICTWYGHNVALRVRSISSFSMRAPLPSDISLLDRIKTFVPMTQSIKKIQDV